MELPWGNFPCRGWGVCLQRKTFLGGILPGWEAIFHEEGGGFPGILKKKQSEIKLKKNKFFCNWK